MLITVAFLFALQAGANQPSIGVAAMSPDNQICVAMPAPALTPGNEVTLVNPDPPQTVLVATIDRPVAVCGRLDRASIPGPYYLMKRTSPEPVSGTSWIAFSGRLDTHRTNGAEVAVQLNSGYRNAQVRSCTSSEGIHFTVWAGTPLRSERLWHIYYYLGYDAVPTCESRDYAEK